MKRPQRLFRWSIGYRRGKNRFAWTGLTCGVATSKRQAINIMRELRFNYYESKGPVFAKFGPYYGRYIDVTNEVFFFDDNV